MILSSISARRTTRDPMPWLWRDGHRSSSPGPLLGLELGGGARLRESSARYSPRTHPPYRERVYHRANPILDLSRDDDWSDPWGTALSWFFPAAAVVEYVGAAEPPPEWLYRSSISGAASDLRDGSWPASQVVAELELGRVLEVPGEDPRVELFPLEDVPLETLDFAEACGLHAGRVFHRLLELVPESDRY